MDRPDAIRLNVCRFHIRILKCADEPASSPTVSPTKSSSQSPRSLPPAPEPAPEEEYVYQQQFGEEDPEFADCTAMVTVLKPNTKYMAQVKLRRQMRGTCDSR